jgi:hypothetical protein
MTIPVFDSNDAIAGALINPEVVLEINALVHDLSVVDYFGKHFPMKTRRKRIPRQTIGTEPHHVPEGSPKEVEKPELDYVELVAENMAKILAFTEDEIDDADLDTISFAKDDLIQAFAEVFDGFALGYDPLSPFVDSWSGNVPLANIVPFGTTGTDLVGDLSEAVNRIEINGYECTGMAAHPRVKHILRNLRSPLTGHPIFFENLRDGFREYFVLGIPIKFTRQVIAAGSPPATEILLAYTPYLYVGDRKEITVKLLTEATLYDAQGEPYSLAQMDSVALRFVNRKAFCVKRDEVLAKVTGVLM